MSQRPTEIVNVTRNFEDHIEMRVHDPMMPNRTGRFAQELIIRFGLIAGAPAGEDSAGRQASGLMSPADIVNRAFDISEAYFAELEDRGMVLAAPDAPVSRKEREASKPKAEVPVTA